MTGARGRLISEQNSRKREIEKYWEVFCFVLVTVFWNYIFVPYVLFWF
jgi:hypothetical protein